MPFLSYASELWPILWKLFATVSAAVFYWDFYRRTYYSGHEPLVSITAFYSGMFATGIALIWEAAVFDLFPKLSPFSQAIFAGALPEEVSKVALALWYLRKVKPSASLADGLYFGLTLGASFGCIENVFYSFKLEFWPSLLRAGTSLPLHTFLGGILGFILLQNQQSRKSFLKNIETIFWFLGIVLLHGVYNRLLIGSGEGILFVPILLGVAFIILEVLMVQSQVTLPFEILQAGGLFIDDYKIIQKYSRYDSWMRSAQSKEKVRVVPAFRPLSPGRTLISILLFGIPIFCANFYFFTPELIPYYLENIDFLLFIALFMEYPAWLGILFLLRGILNPSFFRERILKIPLFLSVNLGKEEDAESTLAYSLSRRGFYSPVIREPELGIPLFVSFYVAGRTFQNILAIPVWKNFRPDDPQFESGALYRFPKVPFRLLLWRWSVRIRQQIRNSLTVFLRKE
ncbi:PrsW family intramembrane metalloprotease [Leptospira perolatii]|uniref:PrsW family intramembrane metalloprotease n=1 Tax=Leptospira perolatii TaxID=2023191 RepID=A0A2M9ZPC0_9LEPT|nr:PrsW family glutamic-type intramembrane protease [Leptospira perolatii]PJZ70644.1 PrsW family intramembrane metalloprotease [Leptospira perolatii]PJZ73855.1 PrsW family intramembrane metalloprotease [Leptospira perolatii]